MSDIVPLVYHRVCPDSESDASPYVISATKFRRQMEYLVRKNYRALSLADVCAPSRSKRRAQRGVVITFDDGYLDTYTTAFPILQELGLTAVVFLVADFSRRTNWWDVPLGVPRANLLEPGHIQEMVRVGIDFGSHSQTHRSLPDLSDQERCHELCDSKKAIEDITGRAVLAFSYPYSHVNSRTKAAVQAAGYACAFAVHCGPLRIHRDLWEIRRVNAESSPYLKRFAMAVNGAERFAQWVWWRGKAFIHSEQRYEIRSGE